MVLFAWFIIVGMLVLISLMLIMIIIYRPKSQYERYIDDMEQLEYIEKYREEKMKKAEMM